MACVTSRRRVLAAPSSREILTGALQAVFAGAAQPLGRFLETGSLVGSRHLAQVVDQILEVLHGIVHVFIA
jgi:hypothetical protein